MFLLTVFFALISLFASPSKGCCKNEITSNICHTIVICVHTYLLLLLLHFINRPLLEYPGKRREYIARLRKARDLLDGCSDDYTQIQTPGPIEFLEEDLLIGIYLRAAYIWILLIIISAYGIYNGIFRCI